MSNLSGDELTFRVSSDSGPLLPTGRSGSASPIPGDTRINTHQAGISSPSAIVSGFIGAWGRIILSEGK